jgi:hypothetical protein
MTEETTPDALLQAMRGTNETLFELAQLELPTFTRKDFYAAFLLPTRDTGIPSSAQLREDFFDNQDTMSMTEGRLAVVRMACAYLGEAITGRARGERDDAWMCVVEANYWLGIVQSTYYTKEPQARLHADVSRQGAFARHAKDKRQEEKAFIKQCWSDWQAGLSEYNGKAEFARDMLNKVERLKSQKTIEDWCRDWEREDRILAGTESIEPAQ